MKKEKTIYGLIIGTTIVLISLILIAFLILLNKPRKTIEDLIIESIQEDQEAVGNELIAYSYTLLKSTGKDYTIYIAEIVNDDGKFIRYIICYNRETQKITYCEEVKNDS